jgi:hypothetical protein
MKALKQRIEKLEGQRAQSWEAWVKSLSDEEVSELAGEEFEGVPWSEITDAELDAIIEEIDSGSVPTFERVKARFMAKMIDFDRE